MPLDVERLAKVEGRMENVEEKIDDMGGDLKAIASDVSAMRLLLAQNQGASGVIKYLTHILVGLSGVVAGFFSTHH